MYPGRNGQFGRVPPGGRWNQSRAFVKQNRPGLRRDGTSGDTPKNNEFVGRRPKIVNGPQRGNSVTVPNNDDAGKARLRIPMHCAEK